MEPSENMSNRIKPQHKETIPNNMRVKVLVRDGFKCAKCGSKKTLEIHHIIPKYNGGRNELFNLVTLCSVCHFFAPDNPIELFRYLSNPNRPAVDLAMDIAEKVFVTAVMLEKEDYENAKADPVQFWRTRYKKDIQDALNWAYQNE